MATPSLVVGQSAPSTPVKLEGAPPANGGEAEVATENQKDGASFPALLKRIAPDEEKGKAAQQARVGTLAADGQLLPAAETATALPPGGIVLPSTFSQDAPLESGASQDMLKGKGTAAAGLRGAVRQAAGAAGRAADAPATPGQVSTSSEATENAKAAAVSVERTFHDFHPAKIGEGLSGAQAGQPAVQALVKEIGNGAEPRPMSSPGSPGASDVASVGVNTHPLQVGDRMAPDLNMQSISIPLRHPQWGDELSNRITWMVRQDVQSASIKLNPPHLGPLEVKISLVNDQVNVSFTAHHAPVREALDGSMARLREMLGENGLQLGDSSVTQHPFSQQQGQQTFAQQAVEEGGQGFNLLGANDLDARQDPLYFVGNGAIDLYA